jgi:hypothetical protein
MPRRCSLRLCVTPTTCGKHLLTTTYHIHDVFKLTRGTNPRFCEELRMFRLDQADLKYARKSEPRYALPSAFQPMHWRPSVNVHTSPLSLFLDMIPGRTKRLLLLGSDYMAILYGPPIVSVTNHAYLGPNAGPDYSHSARFHKQVQLPHLSHHE